MRTRDWRLSFVPFIMGTVYMWLWWFDIPMQSASVILVLLSLITSVGFAALGYFVNEFFDKESDARAGKVNRLAYLPARLQGAILLLCVTLTFLPWIWLPKNLLSYIFIAAQIGLYLVYSLPGIRLKENPYLSVIVDAGYAYLIPLALSFHTYSLYAGKHDYPAWYFFFITTLFFTGVRNILQHQSRDAIRDALSGTKTLPLLLGIRGTFQLVVVLFLYENFFWLFTWVLLFQKAWIAVVYIVIHLIIAIYTYKLMMISACRVQQEGLYINRSYMIFFPIWAVVLAVTVDPLWVVVFFIHIVLFVPGFYYRFIWIKMKAIYYAVVSFIMVQVRDVVSKAVNYPIYYCFRLFGVDLIKENRTAADVLLGRKRK